MAIAPLIPVPATRQMMLLWWEGSAGEKYGPSKRNEILTLGNDLDLIFSEDAAGPSVTDESTVKSFVETCC